VKRYLRVALLPMLLMGTFYAGMVYAADPRLDQALDSLARAQALLEAATNPYAQPEFGSHRLKAILLIELAQDEVVLAQQYADNSAPPVAPSK